MIFAHYGVCLESLNDSFIYFLVENTCSFCVHSPTTSFSINLLQLSLTPCYYQVGPLLSQPILNLFITKSKRWWKHSSEILVYIKMTPLHSFYRFVGFTSMMWTSGTATFQGCLLDCDLLSVEAIRVQWTQITQKPQCKMTWALWHGTFFCWKRPPNMGTQT